MPKRRRLTESPNDEEEAENPEAKRLTARMKKAMEDGEGEIDEETDVENSNVDDGIDEATGEDGGGEGSFHTHSDAGSDEGEELDDSESERLVEGPIDEETKRLRMKMQAAMEATERRALLDSGTISSKNPSAKMADDKGTEDGLYDLGPLPFTGRALPASTLRAAALAEAEKKARKAREAEMEQIALRKKPTRRKMKSRSGPQEIEKNLT